MIDKMFWSGGVGASAFQHNESLYRPCHFSNLHHFTCHILRSRLDKIKLIGAFEKWSSIKQIFPVFGMRMIRVSLSRDLSILPESRSEKCYMAERTKGGSECNVKVSGCITPQSTDGGYWIILHQLSAPLFNFYFINLNIKVFVKSTSHEGSL